MSKAATEVPRSDRAWRRSFKKVFIARTAQDDMLEEFDKAIKRARGGHRKELEEQVAEAWKYLEDFINGMQDGAENTVRRN